ncbi:MAG TPA: T9SS type A sorting domain-containing protein, partial [Cryomorphaceae bacterium]|nr:T9SS type A sorting domain-containing protein [Cryomorphaceae bacterium]
IGTNDNGDVYVTGFSFGLGGEVCDQVNNPLVVDGGFAPTDEQPESFVFKIDNYTSGDANISRGGYFGGGGEEVDQLVGAYQFSISVLPSGSFVLSGSTNSQDGNPFFSPSIQAPAPQPPNYYVEPFAAGSNFLQKDAFLVYFNEDFNLIWSTYFGGSKEEIPSATAVTNDETRLYFVGVQCTVNDLSPAVDFELVDFNNSSFLDYYQDEIIDPQNNGSFPSWCALFDIAGITLSSDHIEFVEGELNVYPNPASNEIRIENIHSNNEVEIRIFDNTGAMVKLLSSFNLAKSIPISNLSAGVYILELKDGVNTSSVKFVKL